jgi:hypothetical protein
MAYASCPTSIVDAPVEIVWTLLTRPKRWGDFYDVRIVSIKPPGRAVVGQRVLAESGPRLLHLKLEFRLRKIDVGNHELGLELNAPPLRVRSGARDFQSEAHRVQNALNGFEIWTRWPTGKSSIKARSFNSRFFRNV